MKMRYLLIAAATILPFAASAVKPTKVSKSGYVYSIPAEFGYDGKSSYFFGISGKDSDGAAETFERINENLETLEIFTSPVQTIESKITRFIPSGFKKDYRFTNAGELPASSLSDAMGIVQRLYPNGYVTVSMRESGYYDSEGQIILFIPGKTIPEGVYSGMNDEELFVLREVGKLNSIDGYSMYWKDRDIVRSYSKTEYNTGELDWSTELIEHSTNTIESDYSFFDNVYYYDDKHEVELPISQILFNSDKDYEILMPIVAVSSEPITTEKNDGWGSLEYTYQGSDGNEYTKSTYHWVEKYFPILYTGVKAVNVRTGAVVTTFEFTEAIDITNSYYISDPDIYVIGDKKYLCVYADEFYYFFDIEDNSSPIKSPVMTKKVNIKPNIVNRGESVMVNVDGNDVISNITITGINGQTLQRINGNGAKSAAIKTNRLGSGVHLVGVQTEDGSQSVGKIIVK